MELQRIPYRRDDLKNFLTNYKYYYRILTKLEFNNLKKEIVVDAHSLDIECKTIL
jgi:hypothetical protein